jgi:ferritin-like metal-binding protein YciE
MANIPSAIPLITFVIETHMPVGTIQELFVDLLKDTYDAEKQLVRALPNMAGAATSPELKAAFEEHLAVTEGQVERLEQIFEELGLPVQGKHCGGMEGLIEEGEELMEEGGDPDVLDAGLIAAAQKVEHYEISAYGTARTWANLLNLKNVSQRLSQSLDEEAETDEALSKLAERLNVKAEVGDESGFGKRM